MPSIAIDRVRTRYRLPASVRGEQPRVQRIVDDALRRVLDGAMERRGIGPDSHVCVRDVHAVATLRLREPDSALSNGVGDAIAAAIEQLIDESSPSVVRYGSRAHALIDLVVSATAGDFTRSWAWAQVGIWHSDFPLPPDLAAERIVRALTREPTYAVPVVAHLARSHVDRLDELVGRATPRAWSALAQAVLAAAAETDQREAARIAAVVTARSDRRTDPARTAASSPSRAPVWQAGIETLADRVIAQSAIARVAIARFARIAAEVRIALGALALLDAEPAAARRGDRVAVLAAMTAAMAAARAPVAVRHAPASAERVAGTVHGTAGITGRPDAGTTRVGDQRSVGTGRGAARPHDTGDASATEWHSRDATQIVPREVSVGSPDGSTGRTSDRRPDDWPSSRDDDSGPAVPAVRQSARSEHGGLLYLLNLLSRTGLVDVLQGDERWSARGLRWVLHQLATALVPIEADDPAALVFAGVAPGSAPPSTEQDPPTAVERDALDTVCAAIVRDLREALRVPVKRGVDADRRLIDDVCRRPARLAADPGWVEARFSIDDVSLDIRRAGLDRDPGWLPWLGIVLRFVYA